MLINFSHKRGRCFYRLFFNASAAMLFLGSDTHVLSNLGRNNGLQGVSVLGGAQIAAARQFEKEKQAITTDDAFAGIRVEVKIAKPASPEIPFIAAIRLENGSKNAIWIRQRSELRQVYLNVSSGGVDCARTKRGEKLLRSRKAVVIHGAIEKLMPSESVAWNVDLNECFMLEQSVYHVSAGVRVGLDDVEEGEVASEAKFTSEPVSFDARR